MKNIRGLIIAGVAGAVVVGAIIAAVAINSGDNNRGNDSTNSTSVEEKSSQSSTLWSEGGISINEIGMSFISEDSCNITMVLANNTDEDYELDMKKFDFKLDNGYTFSAPSSTWTLSANHPYIFHGANFDDEVVSNLNIGDNVHIYYDGNELATITIEDDL